MLFIFVALILSVPFTEGDFTYDRSDSGVLELLECKSAKDQLEIPAKVEVIRDFAFRLCKSTIIRFEAGSSIRTIYPNAFYLSSVEYISFPKTFVSPPRGFLSNIPSLVSIEFNGHVSTIQSSFNNLFNLKYFYLDQKTILNGHILDFTGVILTLDGESFVGCSIETMVMPVGMTSFPSGFAKNAALKTVDFRGTASTLPACDWTNDYPALDTILITGIPIYHNQILDVSQMTQYFVLSIPPSTAYLRLRVKTFINRIDRTLPTPNMFKLCGELTEVITRANDMSSYKIPMETWTIPNLRTISLNGVYVFINGVLDLSEFRILRLQSQAFQYFPGTEIILPATITSFPNYVFANCPNLERVVIPFALNEIPENTFQFDSNLASIVIRGNDIFEGRTLDFTETGIDVIKFNSFTGCLKIEKIIFDEHDITLGNQCFQQCSNLQTIEFVQIPLRFSSSFSDQWSHSFYQTPITKVILPPATLFSSVSHINFSQIFTYPYNSSLEVIALNIQNNVFIESPPFILCGGDKYINSSKSATTATTPDSVQYIGQYAFQGSTIQTLTIDSSVIEIHPKAFSGAKVSKVILTSQSQLSFGLFWGNTEIENVAVNAQITSIPINLFNGCSNLKTFLINDEPLLTGSVLDFTKFPALIHIGENSFKGVLFSQIIFSQYISPSTIDAVGIANNPYLTNVKFEKDPRIFNIYMFDGCTNLKEITFIDKNLPVLQNGVLNLTELGNFEIQYSAFSGVTINQIQFIPASKFTRDSFLGVSNLKNAEYTSPTFPSPFVIPHQIRDFPELLNIIINNVLIATDGVVDFTPDIFNHIIYLGDSTFAEIDSITSVILPSRILEYGKSTFEDCAALLSIKLETTALTKIPSHMFRGCLNLLTLTIGSLNVLSNHVLDLTGLSQIGQNAFALIQAIETIVFPNAQIILEDGAFSQSNVKIVTFPLSVNLIKLWNNSSQPFSGCTQLTTLNLNLSPNNQPCSSLQRSLSFPLLFMGSSFEKESWSSQTNCSHDSRFEYSDPYEERLKKVHSGGEHIDIPSAIEAILDDAFNDTYVLTVSFDANSRLHTLETYVLRNSTVKEITLPPSFTELGTNFLQEATSLESIKFQGMVVSLGYGSFKNCRNLKTVQVLEDIILNNGVFDIRGSSIRLFNNEAFLNVPIKHLILTDQINPTTQYYTQYTELEIIEYLCAISLLTYVYNFNGLNKLHTVKFGSETVYLLKDGLLDLRVSDDTIPGYETDLIPRFHADHIVKIALKDRTLINFAWLPSTLQGIVYDISGPTLLIPEWIWKYNITSLIVNGFETIFGQKIDFTKTSFTRIDPHLLSYISSRFTQIGFPNTPILPASYFAYAHFVQSFESLADVKSIPDSFFEGCDSLTFISFAGRNTLINGVLDLRHFESIGSKAFQNIPSIEFIILPDNFYLGESAFTNSYGLKKVQFLGIDHFTFSGNPFFGSYLLTSYVLPYGLNSNKGVDFNQLFKGTILENSNWRDFIGPSPSQYFTQSNDKGQGGNNDGSKSSDDSGTAAIAIGIICAVFAVVVIGAVLFFIYKKNYEKPPQFDIDENDLDSTRDEMEDD